MKSRRKLNEYFYYITSKLLKSQFLNQDTSSGYRLNVDYAIEKK